MTDLDLNGFASDLLRRVDYALDGGDSRVKVQAATDILLAALRKVQAETFERAAQIADALCVPESCVPESCNLWPGDVALAIREAAEGAK